MYEVGEEVHVEGVLGACIIDEVRTTYKIISAQTGKEIPCDDQERIWSFRRPKHLADIVPGTPVRTRDHHLAYVAAVDTRVGTVDILIMFKHGRQATYVPGVNVSDLMWMGG